MERRRSSSDENVVAVKGDVDLTELGLEPAPLGDECLEPLRQRHAPRVDPDEGEARDVVVALDQLVGESRERPPEGVCVEDLARPATRGGIGVHRFRSFPASLDRFKGNPRASVTAVLDGPSHVAHGRQ